METDYSPGREPGTMGDDLIPVVTAEACYGTLQVVRRQGARQPRSLSCLAGCCALCYRQDAVTGDLHRIFDALEAAEVRYLTFEDIAALEAIGREPPND